MSFAKVMKVRGGRCVLLEDDVSEGVAEGVVFVCEFEGGSGFGTSWKLKQSVYHFIKRVRW